MRQSLLTLLCLALGSTLAYADSTDIKARQQYMKEWGGITKQMGALLKQGHSQNFRAGEFAQLAAHLQQTAHEPWPHYGRNSRGPGSEAKATVWEQPQAFQAAIQRFSQAAQALNRAAQSGNYDAVKTAFGALGQSCKTCHQDFKD